MSSPPVPLAIDVLGLIGQGFFAARMIVQWIASERARRSIMPSVFWKLSLVGSVLLLIYAGWKSDLGFVLGAAITCFIYARNLWLGAMPGGRGFGASTLTTLVAAAVVVTGAVVWVWYRGHVEQPLVWLLLGLCGQVLWQSRFLLQWLQSERAGAPVVPRSFWLLSLAGSGLLLAYAIHAWDLVFILAYCYGPPIYLRNLWLMKPGRSLSAS